MSKLATTEAQRRPVVRIPAKSRMRLLAEVEADDQNTHAVAPAEAKRALIVDAERASRDRLRTMLATYPEIEVVGEASSLPAAAEALRACDPDILFLDIEVGRDDSFALLETHPVRAQVVFVTGLSQYAIRAFEVGALDYLLKPVEPRRLAAAVTRLLDQPRSNKRSVWLPGSAGVRRVELQDLLVVRAQGDYSKVTLRGGQTSLVRRTLRSWEDELPAPEFVRTHRSAIVRVDAIVGMEPDGSAFRLFARDCAAPIPVSRGRGQKVKRALAVLKPS